MVEVWQADAAGLFNSANKARGEADPNFTGWGRSAGDIETGVFTFETVKPGAVPFPDGRLRTPHITVWVVARGINIGLHTCIYFEDEPEANAADPFGEETKRWRLPFRHPPARTARDDLFRLLGVDGLGEGGKIMFGELGQQFHHLRTAREPAPVIGKDEIGQVRRFQDDAPPCMDQQYAQGCLL